MINVIMGVFLVLALACFVYARSCNGRGPSAGCAGLLAFIIGCVFVGLAVLTTVFQLGRHY